MKILEKLKNKKALVFYLVGVLLLSFGVSFAYFVATSSVTGDGITATVETAKVQSDGIVADGNIDLNNIDMYPGHKGIASIKVTGTGDHEPLMFDVIFQGNNTFNTSINYTIYQSNSNIDASYTCEVKNDIVDNGKTYYEECTGNHIDELGTSIGSGTISKGEGVSELLNDEIILTTEEGTITYYYVVIEFPNLDQSQNDDMGASISGNITIQEGSKYQAPNLLITANATSGNNGWYKSVSLNTSITTQTGNYDVTYCVTTEDSCTPNETASITDNSFTTILSDNTNPQKLCVRVTDEYNQIGEGCSEAYLVDGTNPSISITNTSVTENSISVTVNGSDSHSGIAGYRFSNDNGNSYTDINTSDSNYTYTFTGLSSGTTYSIRVQAVDRAGRTSSTVSKSVATEIPSAKDYILAGKNISTRSNFSSVLKTDTTGTIYSAADDDGTTYYYAGAPTDNWLYWAGFYWRIIRINGDGTIRVIYNGTSTATTGSTTQIGNSAFNEQYNDNAYVGFKYGSAGSSSYSATHANTNNSTILTALNTWYQNNLTSYADDIDTNAGFCGDRTLSSGTGTGTNQTYYGADNRVERFPTFKCTSDNDLYTTSESEDGNKSLTYPIGLISIDEANYAGGTLDMANQSYYLYTGQVYWTMSPYLFYEYGSYAYVFSIRPKGNFYSSITASDAPRVYYRYGVRPVINLKADVTITGSGTTNDPYVVS